MTTTPMGTRPGEPEDPELRDRYARDAWERREAYRIESARAAAETPPSRTPSGPIWIIAGLLTVALVIVTGFVLLGPMLRQSESTDQAMPSQVSRLDVSNGTGDVRIRAAKPGERPSATSTAEWGLRKPRTTVESAGGTTTIRGDCPSAVTVCSTEWLIVVPADTELEIQQGVGDVTLEGMSGDVDVSSGVGSVNLEEGTSENIDVEIGVGDVRIESVEPPRRVVGRVGVGDLTVALPDTATYRVDTDSGMSEVRNSLGSDTSSSRTVHVEAGVGGVTVEPS